MSEWKKKVSLQTQLGKASLAYKCSLLAKGAVFIIPEVSYVPEFYDGFQTGDFRKWDNVENFVIVTSPTFRSTYAATDNNDSANLLGHNMTITTSTYYMRFYAYFSNISGGSGIAHLWQLSNITYALDLEYSGGLLYLALYDGTNFLMGVTPITTGWHCIDLLINTGPNALQTIWLDGVIQIQETVTEPTTNIGGYYFFCQSSSQPSWVLDAIIGGITDPTCAAYPNFGV
jgi:hypothetical protein